MNNPNDIELPGMSEPTQNTELEVIDSLTFHKTMAIRRTQDGDAHVQQGIFAWIDAGEHLIEVKAKLPDGEWISWIENDYPKGERQARRYMQAAHKRRAELEESDRSPATGLDPETTLSNYLGDTRSGHKATQDDTPEEPAINGAPVAEIQELPVLVALPGGEAVTPAKAKEELEKRLTRVEEELKATREEQEKTRKAQENARKAKQRADDKAKRIQKKLEEEAISQLEHDRQVMRESVMQELAEVHARYGVQELPKLIDVPEEVFQQAREKSRDKREMEAVKVFIEARRVFTKMRAYEPEEAARGFLTSVQHEEGIKETVEGIHTWLGKCLAEIDVLTTKGVLRAVER